MGSPVPRNNAFGPGSPGWNLAFPAGNLTAAEIIAYLPHWLKSIDVVDRFVTNGGKSFTIAAMVNELRQLPGGSIFRPNSAQIMMAYSMRRAGYEDWTVGAHSQYPRPAHAPDENDLSVERFRTPRETHPKTAPYGAPAESFQHNQACDPVQFKSLAVYVKVHPSGSDALDLTRCVHYAIAHPDEDWYFPNDFVSLVNKLGGPAAVTLSHFDRHAFTRRDGYTFTSPAKSTPKAMFKRTPKSQQSVSDSSLVMPQSRRFVGGSATPGSPLKRMMTTNGTVQNGSRRKSGRLAKKATVNLREVGSDEDFGSPYSSYTTPNKKQKLSRLPDTPGTPSNDSDFVEEESEPDHEMLETEAISSSDEVASPINAARSRAAARKARQSIRTISTETQRNLQDLKRKRGTPQGPSAVVSPEKLQPQALAPPPAFLEPNIEISPEIVTLARNFSQRRPAFLKPPVLSSERLRVDASSVYLYAAEGCMTFDEMWATALSSTRFNGPRRHAPFRELHRLSDPYLLDCSDWAENIRWAKEQHRVFGSDTWTEYDYHLECITQHRRDVLWVSEEAVRSAY